MAVGAKIAVGYMYFLSEEKWSWTNQYKDMGKKNNKTMKYYCALPLVHCMIRCIYVVSLQAKSVTVLKKSRVTTRNH